MRKTIAMNLPAQTRLARDGRPGDHSDADGSRPRQARVAALGACAIANMMLDAIAMCRQKVAVRYKEPGSSVSARENEESTEK